MKTIANIEILNCTEVAAYTGLDEHDNTPISNNNMSVYNFNITINIQSTYTEA